MKVCVSVKGRFHAFHLAHELEKRDCLARLVTSYPKSAAAAFGISAGRVSSVLSAEILTRLSRWLPGKPDTRAAVNAHFQRSAARRVPEDADVFVGWSGTALKALRRARALGQVTIVERGSCHIQYQSEVLAQEYACLEAPARLPHPRTIQTELAEYEEADFISVPSAFAKHTFEARGIPSSKLIHVPYGVSPEDFTPLPKRGRAFRLIHCGSVDVQKGCHHLLQAFAELELPNAELWFVGPVHPEMKNYIERYRDASVVFKGKQPYSALREFYSQASVMCLASIQEGLATVLLHGMASGLPVLASQATGAEDVVRHGVDGLIFEAGDIKAIKERIVHFYDDREGCKRMGQSALRRMRTDFTWNHYGDRIVNAYAGALACIRGGQQPPGSSEVAA